METILTKMDNDLIKVGDIYGYHGYDVEVILLSSDCAIVEFLEGECQGEQIEVELEELSL